MERIKLFCLPFAGGSASMYNSLSPHLDATIELIPIEYAGRGERYTENAYNSFSELVNDSTIEIMKHLNDTTPFAILGYSMGSLVAYEVYYQLEEKIQNRPRHIFFSAHLPPENHSQNIPSKEESRKTLLNNLAIMGLSIDEDIIDYVLPQFLIDLHIYSNYKAERKSSLIEANISVLFSEEEYGQGYIYNWSDYCSSFCNFHKMEGGHLFLIKSPEKFARKVNKILNYELLANV